MDKRKLIPLFTILTVIIIAGCTGTNDSSSKTSGETPKNISTCSTQWTCTDWTTCQRINATIGSQNRTCSDTNNCNTAEGKPSESQYCTLQPITSKEPSELAIQQSDFTITQNNWTLKERVERTRNDVGDYAKEIGWQKGYRITYYTGQFPNIGYIEQGISFYPRENITKILDINNTNSLHYFWYNTTKDNAYYVFDDLSDPRAGEKSIGYRITKSVGSDAGTYYYIELYKLNVYEYFTIWGGTADYELLKDLARKGADKIV